MGISRQANIISFLALLIERHWPTDISSCHGVVPLGGALSSLFRSRAHCRHQDKTPGCICRSSHNPYSQPCTSGQKMDSERPESSADNLPVEQSPSNTRNPDESNADTRPPTLSRTSTFGKKCWICMSDASEDDPNNPPIWRSPCKCSLTAHERSLRFSVRNARVKSGSQDQRAMLWMVIGQ